MLVDANLLLYSVDSTSRFHSAARRWLEEALNGPRRVGFAWPTIGAFLRITTHPRALDHPLAPDDAWAIVTEWLDCGTAWIPLPTERHASVLGALIVHYELRGNLLPDGDLATLAIEHGLEIFSCDTDFARFDEISWTNPLAKA